MTSSDKPTIDEVKALQFSHNLSDIHLCWVGYDSFVLAHTDKERSSIDLEQCELHKWLLSRDLPPNNPGFYYIVRPHTLDTPSKPYVSRFSTVPWDFEPLYIEIDD